MKKQLNNVPSRMMFLVTAFVILCSYCTPIYAQIKIWDKRFGGDDFDDCSTSIATADGGYLLGGHSSSDVGGDKTQAPRGRTDFWIVKINENGIKQWDKRYGGKRGEYLTSIASTSDGGFLLAGWSDSDVDGDKTQPSRGWGDFWVVKINKSGTKLWDKRYGGDRIDHPLDIEATPDGGFLLGGSSYSGISGDKTEASRGDEDFWIVKIDASGNKLWDKRYGGDLGELLTEIVVTPDGGFLLGGRSNSGISGDKTEPARGEEDIWIVRVDNLGNKLWDKTFGGELTDYVSKLEPLPGGGFFIGGGTTSEIGGDISQPSRGEDDFWVIKIDDSGNKLWDRRFGGDLWDGLTSIEPTSDGKFLLGGWSYSNVSGEKTEPTRYWGDFWIIKMDAAGNKLWDKTYGGDQYEGMYNITPMPHGNFLLAGASPTGISGDKTQDSRGGYDFWSIKFNPRRPISFDPRDFIVVCDPFCPFIDFDISSRFFSEIAFFSFRIKLPEGVAAFNKSGHTFNSDLKSPVSFETENDHKMLVTWKNDKNVSLADEASLVKASIKILDNSNSFEGCVSDVQAFNAEGEEVDVSSLCGTISFKNSTTGQTAKHYESSSEKEFSELRIFPNPGTGLFNLAIPEAGEYQVEIYDARGNALRRVVITTRATHTFEILDLQEFSEGVYVLKITNGKQDSVHKIIKH